MRFIPMASAFIFALAGAVAVGLRPGYPFGGLLLGATAVAAMAGLGASAIQFVPRRYFVPVAVLGGTALGLLVALLLGAADGLYVGDVRGSVTAVWPAAVVGALLLSRASGMRMPGLRRRRAQTRR
jgi:hypothetical protein